MHSTGAFVILVLATTASADVARQPPANAGSANPAAVMRKPIPPVVPAPPLKPAPDIATTAKPRVGTWRCKGNTARPDGSSSPLSATLTVKLDLDNAWIVSTLVEKTGPLKWTEFRTYDPTAKQWLKLQMANTSGHVTSTTPGEQSGTWTWEGTAASPQGSVQLRDHEQLSAGQLKLWGQAMVGGAWQKTYEVTCTK